MSEWDFMKGLDEVKAPPDFEQKIMAQLLLRRRAAQRRRIVLRWSMAGSFTSLVAAVVLLNIFVFQDRKPSDIAATGKGTAPASALLQTAADERTVPIIERLDYLTEMHSRSSEPETVYLLEQISDTAPRGIRY